MYFYWWFFRELRRSYYTSEDLKRSYRRRYFLMRLYKYFVVRSSQFVLRGSTLRAHFIAPLSTQHEGRSFWATRTSMALLSRYRLWILSVKLIASYSLSTFYISTSMCYNSTGKHSSRPRMLNDLLRKKYCSFPLLQIRGILYHIRVFTSRPLKAPNTTDWPPSIYYAA